MRCELKKQKQGRLGGSVSWASNFGSGHDLAVRGFEPHVGLRADSSEPGARFGFCTLCRENLSLHFCSVSLKNKSTLTNSVKINNKTVFSEGLSFARSLDDE